MIAALCCFTAALAVLLGGVGLSARAGFLKGVLLPALGGFALIPLHALWRRRTQSASSPKE